MYIISLLGFNNDGKGLNQIIYIQFSEMYHIHIQHKCLKTIKYKYFICNNEQRFISLLHLRINLCYLGVLYI